MSDKKQSSVEWLIEQMIKYELVPKGIHFDNVLFHQAKAMHKEEIIHSHLLGLIHPLEKEATKQAEEYYNETFGGHR